MEESGNPQENILEAVEKEAQWALCLLGEEEEEEKMERKERRGEERGKRRRGRRREHVHGLTTLKMQV